MNISLAEVSPFVLVVALSIINKTLVDYIAAPVKQHWPDLNTWWLQYVALVTGGLISGLAGLNILPFLPAVLGVILTAVLVGGGSNLIFDLVKALKDLGVYIALASPGEQPPGPNDPQ